MVGNGSRSEIHSKGFPGQRRPTVDLPCRNLPPVGSSAFQDTPVEDGGQEGPEYYKSEIY